MDFSWRERTVTAPLRRWGGTWYTACWCEGTQGVQGGVYTGRYMQKHENTVKAWEKHGKAWENTGEALPHRMQERRYRTAQGSLTAKGGELPH